MSAVLVILVVLLWIALGAVALVLLVLALPLSIRARAAVRDGAPSGAARVDWAFGLVVVAASLGGLRVRVAGVPAWRARWRALGGRRARGERGSRGEGAALGREERERRRRERKARRAAERAARAGPEAGGDGGGLRAVLDHRRTLLRMLARFARALHLRLRVNGTLGLDDPAHTAALAAALAQLGRVPGVVLEVELDWLEEAVEGEAEASARVWVPELLAVAAALWMRRANRVAVRALAS